MVKISLCILFLVLCLTLITPEGISDFLLHLQLDMLDFTYKYLASS